MTLLGGAAAYPIAANAQQSTRRVAVLMATGQADPEGRDRLNEFTRVLQSRGWIDKLNLQLDVRWIGDRPGQANEIAAELVALKPDVMVANGTPLVVVLSRVNSTIPVVFVLVNEPVAQGIVAKLEQPGGHVTGFTLVDIAQIGTAMERLKFMAPAITRVGLMYNPESYSYYDVYAQALQSAAGRPVDVVRAAVQSVADIDAAVESLASQPGSGIVLPPDPFTDANRGAIRAAAERRRMPYIFSVRDFVKEGALMSYGPDVADIFRRSADYVDRILKGAIPANLPVQRPDKFELAINVKTAKAMGITVPPALLVIADQVIE